jgi:hypothetical protein
MLLKHLLHCFFSISWRKKVNIVEREAPLDATVKVCLEANVYLYLVAKLRDKFIIDKNPSENVAKFRYLETRLTY